MITRIGTNLAMFWPNNINALNNRQQNTSPADSTTANPMSTQSKTAVLDSSALISSSTRLPDGGWMNASVFKAENHSEDNPVFLVRGTDSNGKPFETEININNVNPRNASFIEMMALDGYYASKGQPLGAARSAAGSEGRMMLFLSLIFSRRSKK